VNGKIKNWKFFTHTMQNASLPFLGDCLDIVCALINKYHRPAIVNIEEGYRIASQMRTMWNVQNELQKYLQELNQTKTLRWSKYNAAMCLFPVLTENNMQELTLGS
jgi:hypothetical protein